MGYVYSIQTPDNTTHLIEPLLFATAAGTSTALTAGISNFVLTTGAFVNVKVGEVGDNATLNVNSTGAVAIYYNGYAISAGILSADNIYTFIYDGVHWNVMGDVTGRDILIGTTSDWQANYLYIAPAKTVIIYTDHGRINKTINNETVTQTVPGFKVSDGSTPVENLPFVGDDIELAIRTDLNSHINNNAIHVTSSDKTFWNNKINCEDEVNNHTLILNRN